MAKRLLTMSTSKRLLFRFSGGTNAKAVAGCSMSKLATGLKYYQDDLDYRSSTTGVQSMKEEVQPQQKEFSDYEEDDDNRNGSCWIPHPRTGIYYPKGHEWVMEDVPDGAACLPHTYWLRNEGV